MSKRTSAERDTGKPKKSMGKGKIRSQDADGRAGGRQQGRQQGSQTGREAHKSNSEEFHRHPGQGMRGKEGGKREASRSPGEETTGSDTRKQTRPPNER